jgi:hypothetical protein
VVQRSQAGILVRRHRPLVEFDRFDRERSGPAGLVAERVLERRLASSSRRKRSIASESPISTRAYRRIVENRFGLPDAEQAFQGLDPGVSVAVAKLRECGRGERDLRRAAATAHQ